MQVLDPLNSTREESRLSMIVIIHCLQVASPIRDEVIELHRRRVVGHGCDRSLVEAISGPGGVTIAA